MTNQKLLLFLSLFFCIISNVIGQQIDTLVFNGIGTIPFNEKYKQEVIEELSGIEYTGLENKYYLIPQTKSNGFVFICSIEVEKEVVKIDFDSIHYFNHGPLEAEAIRMNPKNGQLFITEENNKSYVYQVTDNQELKQVFSSTMPLRRNRGFEGLCWNSDGSILYIGLERQLYSDSTLIIAYNLEEQKETIYSYPLDVLDLDLKKDNGINELLMLTDSTLLVVERAYLGSPHGTTVRVYKASIPSTGTTIIKTKLLTDFPTISRIDNIEGVTYSATGNELIFVSDDNGSKHQQTQLISMKIK